VAEAETVADIRIRFPLTDPESGNLVYVAMLVIHSDLGEDLYL